jgi:hypothetical protein
MGVESPERARPWRSGTFGKADIEKGDLLVHCRGVSKFFISITREEPYITAIDYYK